MHVIVVGAGVIGCAVAFECARRGARVELLDTREPGGGASQASAGILAPYIEGHDPGLRALGVRGLEAYEPFLQHLHAATGRLPEYHRAGTLQAAFDDDGARALAELASGLSEAGIEHRSVTGSEARDLEPSLSTAVVAGLEIPAHGYVAPAALVAALVEGAAKHGATIVRATATGVDGTAAGASVRTDCGVVRGDAVVLAAGSWSSGLVLGRGDAGGAAPSPSASAVRPIRGQLLHLQMPHPVAMRVMWGPGCYVVSRRDGVVLVGATAEDVGFDEHATLGGVRGLANAAVALMPPLASAQLVGVRVGLRPATSDELPIIGPSMTMPNVFLAAGHYRNGVLLAPLTATLVADMVLDGRAGDMAAALRPARFGL